MEAGQGGIRYNDTTKRIQLMDTNKNWVDWRIFDATSQFGLFSIRRGGSNTTTITPDKNGLYLIAYSGWDSRPTVTSTGNIIEHYNGNGASGNSSPKAGAWSFLATDNSSASFTYYTPYSDRSTLVVFYLGSRFTKANLINYYLAGDNVGSNLLRTTEDNHVIIAASNSGIINNYACSTQESYSSTYYACGATISESGSVQMSIGSGSYGSGIVADFSLTT